MKLLLVEDNPNDAELAMRALAQAVSREQMHHVENGEQAIELVFRAVDAGDPLPRVVFLDLKLPKFDGIAVLRRLKGDDRTRHIPVVMLSSSKEDRDMRECYRLGANSYLVKPVGFDEYVKAVGQAGRYWMGLNLTV